MPDTLAPTPNYGTSTARRTVPGVSANPGMSSPSPFSAARQAVQQRYNASQLQQMYNQWRMQQAMQQAQPSMPQLGRPVSTMPIQPPAPPPPAPAPATGSIGGWLPQWGRPVSTMPIQPPAPPLSPPVPSTATLTGGVPLTDQIRRVFGSMPGSPGWNPAFDLDQNGLINAVDYSRARAMGAAPPSGGSDIGLRPPTSLAPGPAVNWQGLGNAAMGTQAAIPTGGGNFASQAVSNALAAIARGGYGQMPPSALPPLPPAASSTAQAVRPSIPPGISTSPATATNNSNVPGLIDHALAAIQRAGYPGMSQTAGGVSAPPVDTASYLASQRPQSSEQAEVSRSLLQGLLSPSGSETSGGASGGLPGVTTGTGTVSRSSGGGQTLPPGAGVAPGIPAGGYPSAPNPSLGNPNAGLGGGSTAVPSTGVGGIPSTGVQRPTGSERLPEANQSPFVDQTPPRVTSPASNVKPPSGPPTPPTPPTPPETMPPAGTAERRMVDRILQLEPTFRWNPNMTLAELGEYHNSLATRGSGGVQSTSSTWTDPNANNVFGGTFRPQFDQNQPAAYGYDPGIVRQIQQIDPGFQAPLGATDDYLRRYLSNLYQATTPAAAPAPVPAATGGGSYWDYFNRMAPAEPTSFTSPMPARR